MMLFGVVGRAAAALRSCQCGIFPVSCLTRLNQPLMWICSDPGCRLLVAAHCAPKEWLSCMLLPPLCTETAQHCGQHGGTSVPGRTQDGTHCLFFRGDGKRGSTAHRFLPCSLHVGRQGACFIDQQTAVASKACLATAGVLLGRQRVP